MKKVIWIGTFIIAYGYIALVWYLRVHGNMDVSFLEYFGFLLLPPLSLIVVYLSYEWFEFTHSDWYVRFSNAIEVYLLPILLVITGAFSITTAIHSVSTEYYRMLIISVVILMAFPLAIQRKNR